jgi:hypothetical protein
VAAISGERGAVVGGGGGKEGKGEGDVEPEGEASRGRPHWESEVEVAAFDRTVQADEMVDVTEDGSLTGRFQAVCRRIVGGILLQRGEVDDVAAAVRGVYGLGAGGAVEIGGPKVEAGGSIGGVGDEPGSQLRRLKAPVRLGVCGVRILFGHGDDVREGERVLLHGQLDWLGRV